MTARRCDLSNENLKRQDKHVTEFGSVFSVVL